MEAFLCRATHEIHRFSGAGGALVACAILVGSEQVMIMTGETSFVTGITLTYFASLGIVRGSGLLFYWVLPFDSKADRLQPWFCYRQMHLALLRDSLPFPGKEAPEEANAAVVAAARYASERREATEETMSELSYTDQLGYHFLEDLHNE